MCMHCEAFLLCHRRVMSPMCKHAQRESAVEQRTLNINLDKPKTAPVQLSKPESDALVQLMAQILVAVHREARRAGGESCR